MKRNWRGVMLCCEGYTYAFRKSAHGWEIDLIDMSQS
jgi:hypothetical protein